MLLSVVIISGSATISIEIAKNFPEGFFLDYIAGPFGLISFAFILHTCMGMFEFKYLEK